MTTEWPYVEHRYFTFNAVLLSAENIIQDHGEYWIAARHVGAPGKIEFFNMTDVLSACVFYDTRAEAEKELKAPQPNQESK